MELLKLSKANAKTEALMEHLDLVPWLKADLAHPRGYKVYSFDILAGITCPGAKDCRSCVRIVDGKRTIHDGPDCLFRCFSATAEVRLPDTWKLHKHNYDLVKAILDDKSKSDDEKTYSLVTLIEASIPKNAGIVRLHVSGDFFHPLYLRAWTEVADMNPCTLFYAYTKSLHLFKRSDFLAPRLGRYRVNFYITASRGGKYDHLIKPLALRSTRVIFKESQARGLPIDHDDSHAATSGYSFALLLHSVQPAGSDASKALQVLKKKGVGSYSRK